jgi:hypothetical protein
LWGRRLTFDATLGYWDDPVDYYRVKLARGQRLQARVSAQWSGANIALTLWRPGTTSALESRPGKWRVAQSVSPAGTQVVSYRARQAGWYYVELQVGSPGGGKYELRLSKTS